MRTFIAKLFGWTDESPSVPPALVYSKLPAPEYYIPRAPASPRAAKIDAATQTDISFYATRTCEISTEPLCFDLEMFDSQKIAMHTPFDQSIDFAEVNFGLQKDTPQKTTLNIRAQTFAQQSSIVSCCTAPHFEFQVMHPREDAARCTFVFSNEAKQGIAGCGPTVKVEQTLQRSTEQSRDE